MIDYELDDFDDDMFGGFDIFMTENHDGEYTSFQLPDMFTLKFRSDCILLDGDDDYDSDIPY